MTRRSVGRATVGEYLFRMWWKRRRDCAATTLAFSLVGFVLKTQRVGIAFAPFGRVDTGWKAPKSLTTR